MLAALKPIADYLDALKAPADLPTLRRLLEQLNATRSDFGRHCCFGDDHYARNIMRRSPWFEMVCVCWKPGQGTPIHDHRGSSCAFKVIEGVAAERRFSLDSAGRLASESETFVRPVGYICASSEADIHEVVNESDQDLITLHIYSPALENINIYCRETGKAQRWAPHVATA